MTAGTGPATSGSVPALTVVNALELYRARTERRKPAPEAVVEAAERPRMDDREDEDHELRDATSGDVRDC